MAPSGGGNIKVVVRVRPFNTREIDRKSQCVVSMKDEQTILTPIEDSKTKNNRAALEGQKTFAYDKSYWSHDRNDEKFAGQESVFEDLGKPLLDNAFQGYNNCIFAYGQTGSGKSYSMMGFGAEPGVIPRICEDMFDRIDKLQEDKNVSCTVEVSYLEIYNERVRDLLNPATKGNLRVREHPSTGPYVEDLAKLVVRSFSEIENLMDEGNKARTVAATNMNETSSRSHAVFTLSLTQKRHDEETKMDMERNAKISLVDLAGSERANSSGATGARLKEGAEINRSLSTLGRVIAALADFSVGKKRNLSMVPYRDSVLTWLLKDSLGGNSMTAMIATISPADINFEETLSTLRYADSAKRIKNHAVINEDANARMIRELKEELAQLRAKLQSGAIEGTMQNGVQYPPDTPLEKQMVTITQADGTTKEVSKADIAEQLSQSEKLYQDLNQTWEQKLQKTEEIHREREAALEDLGISIEKGFVGVSTPKKMPHLVNLSDDPLLAECLVYNLKPGNTTVGNDEMATTAEIRLKGSKILQEHCVFENVDGVVSLVPNDDAAVMVNGRRIDKAKRLHSGYRVILGDFHIFRFNHPQEARAERAEQGSLLKNSITADELDTPSKPSHRRSRSSASGDGSDEEANQLGSESPIPLASTDQEYDWSFARREAAPAILGSDRQISNLTDEELDVLLDDVQRVRANRRTRPENLAQEQEYDSDSVTSYPVREKYFSSTTIDSFSLDTALTAPSTPPRSEGPGQEDTNSQPNKQKLENRDSLTSPDTASITAPDEKAKIEQEFQQLREDMERQLARQKAEYERKIEEMRSPSRGQPEELELSPSQKALAQVALQKWSQRKYVRMAAIMLQYASTLKEAQILSQQMGKSFVFQFALLDVGQALESSYDAVLNGITDEDDEDLYASTKPCVVIRVADFKHHTIYLWSLPKLEKRVQVMRQMHQYLDRPEYIRHFRLDNPFTESCIPQFSRIGEAQVSLTAVFESRVQDFTVDVISPYSFSVVGILKLSLEPSLAEAPPSMLKFNVVLHELAGFPEMEGTDVHAQLFVPRISDEDGATTTQMIKDFNEGPIRFESLHGMSLPLSSSRDSYLRVSIFAKITSMHLDKLLSWDDMRDSNQNVRRNSSSRLAETEFRVGERHDVFAQVQILELSEQGAYQPVEVVQNDTLDGGAYQLHQGLQRRFLINLTHTCGSLLPWRDVTSLRVGKIRLLDSSGQMAEAMEPQADVLLKFISRPVIKDNADGTTNVSIVGQWDSSVHGSLLLDRSTAERHRVQISLMWDVESSKLTDPLKFSLDISLQIRSRSYIRAPSMLAQLWNPALVGHSVAGNFSVDIKPMPVKSTMDLWRLDTKYDYVKGEEMLNGWAPRGVSLIRDYMSFKKRQSRIADIEAAKSVLGSSISSTGKQPDTGAALTDRQKTLLRRILNIWRIGMVDPSVNILSTSNTEPPRDGAAFATNQAKEEDALKVSASVQFRPKNPSLLKSGYLLMPDPTQTRWVRRYLELRRPFLHVYSVPDADELNAINLRDSRVDHQPQIGNTLQRPGGSNSRLHVFAVYARQNAFLFATSSEREKLEWVLRIDESYFGSNGSSSPDSGQ